MPRCPGLAPVGLVYHCLNRPVARVALFEKGKAYAAFERVFKEAAKSIRSGVSELFLSKLSRRQRSRSWYDEGSARLERGSRDGGPSCLGGLETTGFEPEPTLAHAWRRHRLARPRRFLVDGSKSEISVGRAQDLEVKARVNDRST